MSGNKNTFVESNLIKDVNRAAEEAYNAKGKNEYSAKRNKLAYLLAIHADTYQPTGGEMDRDDIKECAYDVIFECIAKWAPGNASFYSYYITIFKKRLKDAYYEKLDPTERASQKKFNKQKKSLSSEEAEAQMPELVRSIPNSDPDRGDNDEIEFRDENENTEMNAVRSDMIKYDFDILNDIVIGQKKRYENSTKICYTPLFYSEFVTNRIYSEKDPSVFRGAEAGLMKTVDHDFISFYMNGSNNSVRDILLGSLKKLSCFSDDPKDTMPCGYQLKNVVYAKYISKIKKQGKPQSDSSISQQRKRFEELIKSEFELAENS